MADIWDLVWGKPQVDPAALAAAIDVAASGGDLDHRTRLLIRDGVDALENHWGVERCRHWLERARSRAMIESIRQTSFDRPGFPFLRAALVEPTRPEQIRQALRELGAHVRRPARMVIGGSCALILAGHLSRATQDIDIVDEVPAELREQHALLNDIGRRYQLALAHFQSHFLPTGWETRVHSLEPFGQLQSSIVDVYDIFLSKLFSPRDKDRDDLRLLLPALDVETILARLRDTCAAFLADETLKQHAERNWYILTGAALP